MKREEKEEEGGATNQRQSCERGAEIQPLRRLKKTKPLT